eukprot:SAG31_NODE_239_length_19453_cov_5.539888_3_plen_91_part_00
MPARGDARGQDHGPYKRKNALTKHMKEDHGAHPAKRHACPVEGCNKTYKAKHTLTEHMKVELSNRSRQSRAPALSSAAEPSTNKCQPVSP